MKAPDTSRLYDVSSPDQVHDAWVAYAAQHPIRGAVVVVDDIGRLPSTALPARVELRHHAIAADLAAVTLRLEDAPGADCKVLFRRSPVGDVYYAISDCNGHMWTNCVMRWMQRQYPHFAQFGMATTEMEDRVKALRRAAQVDNDALRVTEFTYRSRLRHTTVRRQVESDRRWTDLSVEQAFEELYELGATLERIRIKSWQNTELIEEASISRNLEFALSGDFSLFEKVILHPTAVLADKRAALLSGRQRDSGNSFAARPVVIEYDDDVLASLDARKRLLTVIGSMKGTGHSVLHGNPYIHVSFLDYVEDTNCDIYVLSPRRITIVPQTSSTATALERLYSHICSQFAEGRIMDLEGE